MSNINSGIYQIRNLVNGKVYIGSAVNFKVRKNNHFSKLNKGIHCNQHLQNSYNKYGKSNFMFEILEIVIDKNNLIQREQWYLDNCNHHYNLAPKAGSMLNYKHTEATCKKISISKTGHKLPRMSQEQKDNIGLANRGRKPSPIAIQNSIETRKLNVLNGTHHKSGKRIIQLDKYTNEIIRFWDSIKEASIELNINLSGISECCRGKRNTAGKYCWRFV